jgi:hypothetical protein
MYRLPQESSEESLEDRITVGLLLGYLGTYALQNVTLGKYYLRQDKFHVIPACVLGIGYPRPRSHVSVLTCIYCVHYIAICSKRNT